MVHLPPNFYINYREKKVMVSTLLNNTGNHFTVHLEEGDIKLKSEGLNKILWLEKGKGATCLAYHLGRLIESFEPGFATSVY